MPRDSRLLRVRLLYTNAINYVKGHETDGKPVFKVAIASAIKVHVSILEIKQHCLLSEEEIARSTYRAIVFSTILQILSQYYYFAVIRANDSL